MSIGIITLVMGMMILKRRDNAIDHLISSIIACQEESGKIDHERIVKLTSKKQKNLKEKEKFLLGYKAYEDGDLTLAKQYLKEVTESFDDTLKIYSTKLLTGILLLENNEKEFVEVVGELLISIKRQAYNKNLNILVDLIKETILLEGGRNTVIKSLEQVLENTKVLTAKTVCDLKNKLAVLYISNGNYARGIEKLLEVIAQSEEMEDGYYTAKSYIDLGVVYSVLGNNKESRVNIEKGMNIPVKDIEQEAFIKTYAAINLYDSILYEESYDEVQKIQELLMQYVTYLPRERQEALMIMNDMSLARYQQEVDDLQGAERILEEIEQQVEDVKESPYLGIYTNYIMAKAELLRAKGHVEQAVMHYEMALDSQDIQFQKLVLQKLSDILNEAGEYERANVYEKQLQAWYEKEANMVSMDYSNYALYKYEYERKLLEESNKKIKVYIFSVILVAAVSVASLIFILRYIELTKLNKLDGLTKTYNRSYFEQRYSALIEQQKDFAIIIFDIDDFKSINDAYGHLMGDKVIKKVAELSKKVINAQGEIFRYGGEEFVVLIESYERDRLTQLAEELREAIALYDWQGRRSITISLGVVESTRSLRDVLHLADQNLYAAKAQGRNRIVYRK